MLAKLLPICYFWPIDIGDLFITLRETKLQHSRNLIMSNYSKKFIQINSEHKWNVLLLVQHKSPYFLAKSLTTMFLILLLGLPTYCKG